MDANIHPGRVTLTQLPTPVEPLDRLSDWLDGPRLLIKRDDLTGLALGGNKTRKLEYLLHDARQQRARALLTTGAVQSNHCRQTAAAAAKTGMECVLVLAGERPTAASGNLLLDHLFGAEIVWCSREARDDTLERTYRAAQAAGRRPYLIPYGGSNPIGAAAYAAALRELMDQGVRPDWIVFASSSGGTQAGLLAGARRHRFPGQILGISVDEPATILKPRIAALATGTLRLLETADDRIEPSFAPEDVRVNDEYVGAGYGRPAEGEREAIQAFSHLEGILLDPVYTGRAAAGLIGLARQGFFGKEDTVLFWHTGGTPALFSESYRAFLLSAGDNEDQD